MTITLRIILMLVSVLNCVWIIRRIQTSQVRIEDSVFWVLFSCLLICMSLIPRIVEWGALITGVQSIVNFVFLIIIFVLMLKLFCLSIRLSQVESKLQTLAQSYAIDKFDLQEETDSNTFG